MHGFFLPLSYSSTVYHHEEQTIFFSSFLYGLLAWLDSLPFSGLPTKRHETSFPDCTLLFHSSRNAKKSIEWQALFEMSVCSAVNSQMPSKVITTRQKPRRPTPVLATDDFTIILTTSTLSHRRSSSRKSPAAKSYEKWLCLQAKIWRDSWVT